MNLLEYITKYKKTGKVIIIGYFLVLISFNLFFHEGEIKEKLLLYVIIAIRCVVTYFVDYIFLRLLPYTSYISKRILRIILLIIIAGFGIYSIISGIYYVTGGFYDFAFVAPIICLASLKVLEKWESER